MVLPQLGHDVGGPVLVGAEHRRLRQRLVAPRALADSGPEAPGSSLALQAPFLGLLTGWCRRRRNSRSCCRPWRAPVEVSVSRASVTCCGLAPFRFPSPLVDPLEIWACQGVVLCSCPLTCPGRPAALFFPFSCPVFALPLDPPLLALECWDDLSA